MVKIGVVLSGCGVFDGAEIHESVITLLALARKGVEVVCLAPDMDFDVVDHRTQQPTGEKRNVLTESARIARGDVLDLKKLDPSTLDAVIFPGGFGAAKNLSTFAMKGADAVVQPDVARLVKAMHAQKKPIGAVCIAPATMAAIFKGSEVALNVTIGNDPGTSQGIEACGAQHTVCPVEDIVVDDRNRMVTTPAYMLGPGIRDVAIGIEKLVDKIVAMAR
ncbi:MAG: isoprenoid biosynthesis glyoxalase ElbB [Pseudomonadota bacterium]